MFCEQLLLYTGAAPLRGGGGGQLPPHEFSLLLFYFYFFACQLSGQSCTSMLIIPLPCYVNFATTISPRFFSDFFSEKKVSELFQDWRRSIVAFCPLPPPPITKHPGAAPAYTLVTLTLIKFTKIAYCSNPHVHHENVNYNILSTNLIHIKFLLELKSYVEMVVYNYKYLPKSVRLKCLRGEGRLKCVLKS